MVLYPTLTRTHLLRELAISQETPHFSQQPLIAQPSGRVILFPPDVLYPMLTCTPTQRSLYRKSFKNTSQETGL